MHPEDDESTKTTKARKDDESTKTTKSREDDESSKTETSESYNNKSTRATTATNRRKRHNKGFEKAVVSNLQPLLRSLQLPAPAVSVHFDGHGHACRDLSRTTTELVDDCLQACRLDQLTRVVLHGWQQILEQLSLRQKKLPASEER